MLFSVETSDKIANSVIRSLLSSKDSRSVYSLAVSDSQVVVHGSHLVGIRNSYANLLRNFDLHRTSPISSFTRPLGRLRSSDIRHSASSDRQSMAVSNSSEIGSQFDTLKEAPSSSSFSSFLEGLMPKEEIGATRFLQKFPEFDGRGVKVAIFDSGVDPGAAGLQLTSDGKPKILDVLDCSGGGDIDTSTVVEADEEGNIVGASGTKLQVNRSWTNPSGKWRVGVKRLYELFADPLVQRVKSKRKKAWDIKQRNLIASARAALLKFDEESGKSSLSDAKKKNREELQARLDLLNSLAEGYEDSGPVIDAVVWHDGVLWRAALDTRDLFSYDNIAPEEDGFDSVESRPTGLLAEFTPMTNFKYERQYGTFSRLDACNYALNIYDDGKVLSIVTDVTGHGTHVAGITAAFHPEEPALNGIAPGAQIISCKIGDTRLGSMETGTGLTRALIAVIEHGCDLINMSYGEPSSLPDHGRFIKLVNEVVYKHGVIFVSSAGNNGPALTTVGAPGGTTGAILGIGAFVSPNMASSAHSLVEALEDGMPYTWSSRGPSSDGANGVVLSAPGCAVAPVSQWSLQRRQLMNGTSMSSPCACGGIALVLSGVKSSGAKVSPRLVRQALETTALTVGTGAEYVLAMGRGLLQVDKAFEYLEQAAGVSDHWYQVKVANTATPASSFRGIYLREPLESKQISEWRVSVDPQFHEDADNLDHRQSFEEKIQVHCSADWIQTPSHVLLPHNGRTFNVRVDPRGLPPGIHVAEISGIDAESPWRGAVISVPVTVVVPIPVPVVHGIAESRFMNLEFLPGHIERRFVEVPPGATWVEASIQLSKFDTPRTFLVHAVQLLPVRRFTFREYKSYLSFPSSSSKFVTFKVEAQGTLEFTLAQFWSSGSGSRVPAMADIKLSFYGIQSSSSSIVLDGSVGAARVDLYMPFAAQRIAPVALLNRVRMTLRPSDSKLQILNPDRDMLPDNRQIHSLLLTYNASISEGGKFHLRVPLLNRRLYENEIETQYYMIFDSNKKLLSQGNVYPEAVKLTKGDIIIRLLLRHDNVSLLEKLKKLPLILDRNLEDKASVKLPIYKNMDGVVAGENAFKPVVLAQGGTQVLFIGAPAEDKLPKDAAVGTTLLGRISYSTEINGGAATDSAKSSPASDFITYIVPQPCKNEDKGREKSTGEEVKSVKERLHEEIRDAKLKLLGSLAKSSDGSKQQPEFEELLQDLKKDYPLHLPLLVELLKQADDEKDQGIGSLRKTVEAADAVIDAINLQELALYFGVKQDNEGQAAQKRKKEMESKRDTLIDALHRKGLALAKIESLPDATITENGTVQSYAVESVEKTGNLQDTHSLAEDLSSSATPSVISTSDSLAGGEEVVSNGIVSVATLPAKETLVDNMENSRDEVDLFELNYAEIKKWADLTLPKFSMLVIHRERREKRLGVAFQALQKALDNDSKSSKELYEMKVKLLNELGFKDWALYEQRWNKIRFPKAFPLI